ncbi:MAG TPA: ADOP family duplicated permease [Gemmatimonadaceae bacterium]|nr:ADOP family duplicated permease [Gemmatimonadaceae bacterium]
MTRFHNAQSLIGLYQLRTDLARATRSLLRTPGFSLAVVLTLALGIGANSAMFTVVNAVLFRPLPYPESHRIVSLSRTDEGRDQEVVDDRTFRALAAGGVPSFESVAAWSEQDVTVMTSDGPVMTHANAVTPGYFGVYGFRPVRGRVFTGDEEDRPVVVLSEQMWRTVFASDPAILGRTVVIDNKASTIVGIMPAVATSARREQLWIPLVVGSPVPNAMTFWSVSARLRPGATIDAARVEFATLERRVHDPSRRAAKHGPPETTVVMTLRDRLFGDSRRALLLLFSTVGVLLLVACANLANLSLARAARREREFALRLVLGASSARIVWYVLLECLLLAAAGAGLGLLLASASVGYLVSISPGSVANAENVRVDAVVLAFTFAIAVATSVLFGLVPALRAASGDANLTLATGTSRAAGSRREQLMRRTLIVAQLATALVVMTGAAIVTKTLARVAAIDTGFDSENLIAIRPSLGSARYTPATSQTFYTDLMTRLRDDPGARSVALVDALPLGGVRARMTEVDTSGKRTTLELVSADQDYFATIGARFVAGRGFTASDVRGAPLVVVVNETLARERFGGQSPLGRTIRADGNRLIVGVVHDIRHHGLEAPVSPVIYRPIAQERYTPFETILVRTVGRAPGIADRARAMVREMDAGQVAPSISAVEEVVSHQIAPRRFAVVLLGIFAALAAALALVGLYGVLSYLVAERTREIGIRVALGADSWRVLRSVLGSGLALTALGLLIGAGAAAFTVRFLQSAVYDMSVYDPWMFAAAAALLALVALVASYLPARRAAAIDPVTALRTD